MDELVKELMSATPIVSQISKRTGLSMEQLDQVVRITPCVVIDDDGDEMITFLASTTMCSKPGFMAEAYEFGIARLHSEYYINPEKAEKKVRLALEDEFKQLNWAATADAVCDTNVVLADKNNVLSDENTTLNLKVAEDEPFIETGRKVRANKGALAKQADAEVLRKKIIDAWLKKGFPEIWETGERAPYGSQQRIAKIMGCSVVTVKRALKEKRHKIRSVLVEI
ncbi:hypothetical protein U8Y61_001561 [Escherichia coli]|uniref:hypothetical protein n=1 Tax=Escherichia coli TaxID=562 RepID=UPI00111A75B0|nr:hypothetical protein [Escherichia coli]EMB2427982.1 hypothetical protein [Escherichia coli]MBW8555282.1 hypothetical protein [Escherichia coli]MCU0066357.1 hypothetical protein [Escherichia coli]